ncbi:hypothetical protein [Kitasatospora sp. NPDC093102]|uniref:hypothetical protein n=1 Tax=Kitasatospora sp. NPDC093102 TaxID=3155069 RepID=UPI003418BC9A
MSIDVLPSSPGHPPGRPGDAERAPRELMTLPGRHHDVRRWHLVEIRLNGRWAPALLTVWRRPPGSPLWVVHVAWGPDIGGPGEERWAWFLFDAARIRPLAEPADDGETPRDTVRVPPELAGPSGVEPGEGCWRLAWLHAAGTWRSALITIRRRPTPHAPWIAYARWGEDQQAGWVVVDDSLRLIDPAADTTPHHGEQSR